VRHAETLTEVLSGQIDRACNLSSFIQGYAHPVYVAEVSGM